MLTFRRSTDGKGVFCLVVDFKYQQSRIADSTFNNNIKKRKTTNHHILGGRKQQIFGIFADFSDTWTTKAPENLVTNLPQFITGHLKKNYQISFFLAQNLAPRLPTMQFDRWQFSWRFRCIKLVAASLVSSSDEERVTEVW